MSFKIREFYIMSKKKQVLSHRRHEVQHFWPIRQSKSFLQSVDGQKSDFILRLGGQLPGRSFGQQ